MQPNPNYLLKKLELNYPLIGVYHTANTSLFAPFAETGRCIFDMYENWQKGLSLLLSKEKHSCPGSGYWMCGAEGMPRKQFVDFLANKEGLKATEALMDEWIDTNAQYELNGDELVLGPLKPAHYDALRTVTFFVNPDQLSVLTLGSQYFSSVNDPAPVIAPFGSGCMLLLSLFQDLNTPQAIIGATDLAMRQHLPPDIMTFTVTKAMFERLCKLDENSFLEKPFIKRLKEARGKLSTHL